MPHRWSKSLARCPLCPESGQIADVSIVRFVPKAT
jgi:hypothetical protein